MKRKTNIYTYRKTSQKMNESPILFWPPAVASTHQPGRSANVSICVCRVWLVYTCAGLPLGLYLLQDIYISCKCICIGSKFMCAHMSVSLIVYMGSFSLCVCVYVCHVHVSMVACVSDFEVECECV